MKNARDAALRQFSEGIDKVSLGLALVNLTMKMKSVVTDMEELSRAFQGIYWMRRFCRSVAAAVSGVSQ